MGGVDLADQMIKYYHIERKTIKWYTKLFFHLIDMAIHNAFVIHKEHTGSEMPTLKFRLALIDQMLLSAGPDPNCRGGAEGRPRPSGTDLQRMNGVNHYPSLNPPSIAGRIKFRQCRVCNKTKRSDAPNRKRKKTNYCCQSCGDIPLRPAPCFR